MELSREAPRVLLTAQARQGTAQAQPACNVLHLGEQACCLLTAQGLQILTCRCFFFFFNLLLPSGVISVLSCTANIRHFTYKLPAGMTPSILLSIHKMYYLFQFKRDHCWIIQLLMRIYIYILQQAKYVSHFFFKVIYTNVRGNKKISAYTLMNACRSCSETYLSFRQYCKLVSICTTSVAGARS